MQDNTQRYRSLVLSNVYIAARKNRTTVDKLPPDTLADLGIIVIKGRFNSTQYEVMIPENIESRAIKQKMADFEAEVENNREIFARPDGKKKKEILPPRKQKGEAARKKDFFEVIDDSLSDDLAGFSSKERL